MKMYGYSIENINDLIAFSHRWAKIDISGIPWGLAGPNSHRRLGVEVCLEAALKQRKMAQVLWYIREYPDHSIPKFVCMIPKFITIIFDMMICAEVMSAREKSKSKESSIEGSKSKESSVEGSKSKESSVERGFSCAIRTILEIIERVLKFHENGLREHCGELNDVRLLQDTLRSWGSPGVSITGMIDELRKRCKGFHIITVYDLIMLMRRKVYRCRLDTKRLTVKLQHKEELLKRNIEQSLRSEIGPKPYTRGFIRFLKAVRDVHEFIDGNQEGAQGLIAFSRWYHSESSSGQLHEELQGLIDHFSDIDKTLAQSILGVLSKRSKSFDCVSYQLNLELAKRCFNDHFAELPERSKMFSKLMRNYRFDMCSEGVDGSENIDIPNRWFLDVAREIDILDEFILIADAPELLNEHFHRQKMRDINGQRDHLIDCPRARRYRAARVYRSIR